MEAKEIIERLKEIIEDGSSVMAYKQRLTVFIDDLEEEELRNEVYAQFGWHIERDSAFAPDLIAAAREGKKIEFINNAKYVADTEWLEDNFAKLGQMMECVCQLADAKEATDAADVKEKE